LRDVPSGIKKNAAQPHALNITPNWDYTQPGSRKDAESFKRNCKLCDVPSGIKKNAAQPHALNIMPNWEI